MTSLCRRVRLCGFLQRVRRPPQCATSSDAQAGHDCLRRSVTRSHCWWPPRWFSRSLRRCEIPSSSARLSWLPSSRAGALSQSACSWRVAVVRGQPSRSRKPSSMGCSPSPRSAGRCGERAKLVPSSAYSPARSGCAASRHFSLHAAADDAGRLTPRKLQPAAAATEETGESGRSPVVSDAICARSPVFSVSATGEAPLSGPTWGVRFWADSASVVE